MPVSALVLNLSHDPVERASALSALEAHPAFAVGVLQDDLLPLALDTPNAEENEACWRWARELAGVRQLEVLHITFDEAL